MRSLIPIQVLFIGTAAATAYLTAPAHPASNQPVETSKVSAPFSVKDPLSPKGIERLRAAGPFGLAFLFEKYGLQIADHRDHPRAQRNKKERTEWEAISRALDTVAAQRDAYTANLYWYTDLNAARRAAKAQNKPILSLRMLGKLTDEYSCANSRFFRTALYANEEVSQLLRDKYVLHWQMERPVPIVTIDMGEGRQIKRTLTGNSAHYLLDSDGRPLDALPGLYGPGAFQRWLEGGNELFAKWQGKPEDERTAFLASYHNEQIDKLAQAFIPESGPQSTESQRISLANSLRRQAPAPSIALHFRPSAEAAGALAVGKAVVEFPILNVSALYASPATRDQKEEALWTRMALRWSGDAVLDANSLNLMRAKTGQTIEALPVPDSFATIEDEDLESSLTRAQNAESPDLIQLSTAGLTAPDSWKRIGWDSSKSSVVAGFQRNLALDGVRNEYRLHAPIHVWFARDEVSKDFEALNRAVYDVLFQTPKSDPWLGLQPDGLYAALPNDGLIVGQGEGSTGVSSSQVIALNRAP